MRKIVLAAAAVLFFLSCQEQPAGATDETSRNENLSLSSLEKVVETDPKAMEYLNAWPEYRALESEIERVYESENKEDLILVVEELIQKQNALEASVYPEPFDVPQIRSRQKVFKTYLLKLKAALDDRSEALTPAKEMVVAYNAMRKQFNVIVNNTLDTNLILED